MQSNPARVRSPPVLSCSATRPVQISSSRPLLSRRVRFARRTFPFCGLSHFHRYKPLETFPIIVNQKRISPPKNKTTAIDGAAAGTCDNEKEGLTEEEEKKSCELVEGLSEEEEKKESDEPLGGLSEEERKKIVEFVEGLSEEQKMTISKILLGLKEEKNEFVEGLNGEEEVKTGELVEGLSEEGKMKISKFLQNLSEIQEGKVRQYVEGLSEEERKKIRELLEDLSEEGMKRIDRLVVKNEETQQVLQMFTKGGDLGEEDKKNIKGFFKSLSREEKIKFYELVEGFSEEKKNKDEEKNKLAEVLRKKVRYFLEGLSKVEMKKYIKFFEASIMEEEEMRKMMEFTKNLKKEGIKKIMELFEGLSEEEKKIFEELKDSLREEAKKFAKLGDLANDLKEMGDKDVVSKRSGFIAKVFGVLAVQLLSSGVAYGAMKMCPQITAALNENYFQLFSLLLTGAFLLPTCQAFKNDILNSIALEILVNGVNAALGAALAYVHLANSNGLLMLGGLMQAFALLFIPFVIAEFQVVVKGRDLSCFRPSKYSFTAPIIASLIRILNPSPFSYAIEGGVSVLVLLMLLLYDTEKILKHFDDDGYTAASAHLFWDFYGLFISTIKILRMLH